jgi:hypothetical protein
MWDIRITFLDVVPPRGDNPPEAVNPVGIVMPPDRAAALAALLVNNLILFEDGTKKIDNAPWRWLVDAVLVARAKQTQPKHDFGQLSEFAEDAAEPD